MHISQRRSARRAAILSSHADAGPEIQHRDIAIPARYGFDAGGKASGSVLREAGSVREARLGQTQWDDPADTNERAKEPWQVYGVRRRDSLREMHERDLREIKESGLPEDDERHAKRITLARWRGAEDFRRDAELMEGARPPRDLERVDQQHQDGSHIIDRQMRAAERYRGATQAVGMVRNPILIWSVLEGRSLRAFEAERHVRNGSALPVLLEILDVLADFYSGAKKGC